jgi:hypothetical protein
VSILENMEEAPMSSAVATSATTESVRFSAPTPYVSYIADRDEGHDQSYIVIPHEPTPREP